MKPAEPHDYARAEIRIEITRSGGKLLVELAGRRHTYGEDVRIGVVEIVAPTQCSVSALHNYVRAVVTDALLEPETLTLKRNLEAFEPE